MWYSYLAETGAGMPDVAMIPAIAGFFEVSTDELFSFNLLELEEKVMKICSDAADYADQKTYTLFEDRTDKNMPPFHRENSLGMGAYLFILSKPQLLIVNDLTEVGL